MSNEKFVPNFDIAGTGADKGINPMPCQIFYHIYKDMVRLCWHSRATQPTALYIFFAFVSPPLGRAPAGATRAQRGRPGQAVGPTGVWGPFAGGAQARPQAPRQNYSSTFSLGGPGVGGWRMWGAGGMDEVGLWLS